MLGRIKKYGKLTTTLFVVSFLELFIIGLYLSVGQTPAQRSYQQLHTPFSLTAVQQPTPLPLIEVKPTFLELFKEASGIERRLPKLLHDYFKETAFGSFPPHELVGLLNLELNHVKGYALSSDALTIKLNPHNPLADTDIVSIAIKKELLMAELKDEYFLSVSQPSQAKADFEISTQPKPGNVINPAEKMLVLTFDDGPDGNTHALLDALYKYEANATFFVLGQKVSGGMEVLKRMLREGNEIGNHSWNHPDLRELSPEQLGWQVQETQRAIQNATGFTPIQMRPPYGATNPSVDHFLQNQGLAKAMWHVDTNDWRDRNADIIYDHIMTGAGDGKVILLHDTYTASVHAAIRAIPELKAQGYQFVTQSQRNQYR